MKIRVVGQVWFREHSRFGDPVSFYEQPDSDFWQENNFITIRNSFQTDADCAVPVNGEHILKLCFDDGRPAGEGISRCRIKADDPALGSDIPGVSEDHRGKNVHRKAVGRPISV